MIDGPKADLCAPQRMSKAVEAAYQGIREAIITGDLLPGAPLREQELAGRLGISRTPVREALNRLNAEGLVVLERYRRGYVANFDEADVREIWSLRAQLEGYAARRAASRVSERQIEQLEALEDEMERVYAERGWKDSVVVFDRLNSRFHAIIAEAAASPRLEGMLHGSLELPASILARYAEPVDDRIKRTFWQHREIIAALRFRNAAWAEAQMSAHLASLIVPAGRPTHGAEDVAGAGDAPPGKGF